MGVPADGRDNGALIAPPQSPRSFAIQHARPKSSFTGCSRISDYEVLGKLGEGTFGEVHKAKSKKTGAIVALKKIIMHNEKDGVRIPTSRGAILLLDGLFYAWRHFIFANIHHATLSSPSPRSARSN